MNITNIGRSELGAISRDVKTCLKEIGDKYGIEIDMAGGTYGGITGTIKLSLSVRETVEGKNGAKQEFESLAPIVGVKKDAYGKRFTYKRKIFEVFGINVGAPVYPIQAKCLSDGRIWRFPVSTVNTAV